jgi:adenine C2-methylase RlmN of 23S rRNA A2503 and tRNA A37
MVFNAFHAHHTTPLVRLVLSTTLPANCPQAPSISSPRVRLVVVPALLRMADRTPVSLAVSLHAPDDFLRDELRETSC